jgi:hypothetical protein
MPAMSSTDLQTMPTELLKCGLKYVGAINPHTLIFDD